MTRTGPAPQPILRLRLLEQLDAAADNRAILISASAGFGKSTLLRQWASRRQISGAVVAMVTLDEGCDNPTKLFEYIWKSLREVGVEIGGILPPAPPLVEKGASPDFVQTLAAIRQFERPIDLFVDDVHHLGNPQTLKVVEDLILAGAPNLKVVLAGRVIPSLKLSHCKAEGQIAELSASDLAFDDRETAEFLKARTGLELEAPQLGRLRNAVSGWPAGMQLLSLGARQRIRWDVLSNLRHESSGVRDYVRENILIDMDADQCRFIERLALLRRFCPALAIAVTGYADARARIAELERRQLFVSRCAEEGRDEWYTIHSVFAAAVQIDDPERGKEVEACHEQAIKWFAANGYLLDAVNHARSLDIGALEQLIEAAPIALRNLSQLGAACDFLKQIDPSRLGRSAKILPLGAWSFLLSSQLDRARAWAHRMDDMAYGLARLPKRAILSGIALYEDRVSAIDALIGQTNPLAIDEAFLRQSVASQLVTLHQSEGRFEAADLLIDTMSHRHRHEPGEMALIVRSLKCAGLLARGLAVSAEASGRRALRLAEQSAGRDSVSAAIAAAFTAEALYERNQLEPSRALLSGRWHMLRYSPPVPLARAVLTHIRRAACDDGPVIAATYATETLPWFEARALFRAQALLLHERLRLELIAHRLTESARTLNALKAVSSNAGSGLSPGTLGEISYLLAMAEARFAIADSAPERALRKVERAEKHCAPLGRATAMASLALVRVRACAALGRTAEALSAAQPAVDLARAGGLRRTLLDEGPQVMGFLRAHAKALDVPDDLLGAIEMERSDQAMEDRSRGYASPGSCPSVADTLTDREIDIAHLIGRAMSNKHIAAELGLSPATVKWNVENILRKLGVATRYDVAVRINSMR